VPGYENRTTVGGRKDGGSGGECISIREHNQIGRTQIRDQHIVRDILESGEYARILCGLLQERPSEGWRVWFSDYEKLAPCRINSLESVQQVLKTFVFPNQSEEKEHARVVRELESLPGLRLVFGRWIPTRVMAVRHHRDPMPRNPICIPDESRRYLTVDDDPIHEAPKGSACHEFPAWVLSLVAQDVVHCPHKAGAEQA
jgi:hypothetical protein